MALGRGAAEMGEQRESTQKAVQLYTALQLFRDLV